MNVTPNGCMASMPLGYQPHLRGPYIAAELFVAMLAITGNFLVCLAVTRNRRLRTVTNYFLVSLAVADILVGLVAIPCAMLTDLGRPHHDLPLCLVLLSILMVLMQSSILSLLAVAAERYVAILRPFHYQRIMSPRNARLALLLTWSLSLLSGSVPLMDWHKENPDTAYCLFTCLADMTYMVYFNFFGCLLVPLILMFIIYGQIFLTIRRQLRRITVPRRRAIDARLENQHAAGSSGDHDSRTETRDRAAQSSASGWTGGGGADKGTGTKTGSGTAENEFMTEVPTLRRNCAQGLVGGDTSGDGDGVGVQAGSGVDHTVGLKTELGAGSLAAEKALTGAGMEPGASSGSCEEEAVRVGVCHRTGLGLSKSGVRTGAWAKTTTRIGVKTGFIRPPIETKTTTILGTRPGTAMGSADSSSSSGLGDAHPGTAREARPTLRASVEFRKATSLFLVLFLFMICWIPIHLINCVLLLCPQCPVPMPITLAAILLSHINSALNPLLYAYRMRSFRHTLKGMCVRDITPKDH